MPPIRRSTAANTLRIIGGRWRGRKLSFPALDGLRPTGDRWRETLFNWLAADIPGARCLDLFAGAGALGLEALSRGAAEVLMIDRQPAAVDRLRRHLRDLDAANGRVLQADALAWLQGTGRDCTPYDVVFVDPPFAAALWADTITALSEAELVAAGGAVYIEAPVDFTRPVPPDWHLHREKSAGNVCFRLYYRQ
ncbi:16S rRNA (guanine(966)-N(2))-methyltransferase RsmD [Exilibacterium tricleocarpae]|uniref:Ribosomal RNA small subunit methyltransferase D n=1 Tax=Exilibacterium tricleocarpae TaxID=2591008 RepID=A0A545TZC1_9GAMM|nr:16S rRNA (guanine(966)-N(2))-methyltransferase RsmD [Exilibacterium tricleocarpae]TQV82533.1 16S rRNA (guanine(966)-N(2))-methyltransferase RsmD [Exilibacterium tricleocarpae]